MALQSCPRIFWPEPLYTAPTEASVVTLDAAGEYLALIFAAQESMTISHIGFDPGTCTGSPTGTVRVETVDTSTGLPSGTLWATNTNATTATLTSNTWALTALTASASVSPGQVVCIKISYNSGTSFIVRGFSPFEYFGNLPYRVINTGTPTIAPLEASISLGIGSGTTSFYNVYGAVPISTGSTNTFNNTSSARRGLRFQIPFKARCIGLWWASGTAVGDVNAGIWDDGGSEVSSSSTAYDGDITGATSTDIRVVYFDNPVTLSPATWYRAAIEPSSATNANISTLVLPSSDYRSGTPWGSNAHYTTYVASSWTDTATDTLPLMGIVLDQLSDDAGSGGTGGYVIGG